MSVDPGIDLALAFVSIGREIAEQPDLACARERIVGTATKITGCDWAALAPNSSEGAARHLASTDGELSAVLADIDRTTDDGPTRRAICSSIEVTIPDVREDRRWPSYSEQLLTRTPIRSVLGLRLHLHDQSLGALMLYAAEPYFFTPALQDSAAVYAEHASLAYHHALEHDLVGNLQVALATNRDIGMALGVLMARRMITQEEAFSCLRVASQQLHRKLRDLALDVILTGELPPVPKDKVRT